ncbi:MAG: hypothetical protein ACUVXA_15185 [Candidatus Jordarchaeum sp.]|uniref:hypothetical protein n=1 Tax=Candidatus Jordarchaeum sp. TaxID=2823881 RepID=UPI00404994D8
MSEIADITDFFIQVISNLKNGKFDLCSPLEEIVLKSAGNDLAYIDNRKDAKNVYGVDIWKELRDKIGEKKFNQLLEDSNITKNLQYSKSQQFPDFIFKVRKVGNKFTCGGLLELKDSKGGSISSFNSTIPTRTKNLKEIEVVNGGDLVLRIASIVDGKSIKREYCTSERRCFYLVRTHSKDPDKVKVSIIDGSFFETISKDHLLYQVLLQILHEHIKKKELQIPKSTLEQVQKVLSEITDQTIIAASRNIEGASIRPRLRIMAEVHNEGNPHSSHYPQILEKSFNLILKSTPQTEKIKNVLLNEIPELKTFTIKHKRNGDHTVLQLRLTVVRNLPI